MANEQIRPRDAVESRYKWHLEDIYPDFAAWEADFERAKTAVADMKAAQSALKPGRDEILAVLERSMALTRLVERLYAFARMRRDEDSRIPQSQAAADRAETLAVQASEATAFLRPALLAMPESLLKDCMQDAAFDEYTRLLASVLRHRPHTLPAEQETLLAGAGELANAPSTIYTLFTEADLTFPDITGEDGKPCTVSDARLLTLLGSRDGRVRKEAYESVMNTYGRYGNTFASIYGASVKADVFFARTHRFSSAIEASLFDSEIPVQVYDALQTAIDERLPPLNRYLALRKRALGLEALHMWDLYVDTVADYEMKLTYDEAFDLVLRALAPLGRDYVDVLARARDAGWVDVMENAGKHHGAYSWGVYGVHPYVMMNFEGTFDSASTLAHELGHAMHSYFSNQAQPFAKADYTLFAAEVASTVNEVLLNAYLLEKESDPAARQFLLGTLLEHFRTTVFRQTLFATFERETHARQEKGEALTRDTLCALYHEINRRFYGASCVVDDAVQYEWMRIPHFYRAFYVYQYATGFSAAVCIARRILREGEAAVEGYRKFLAAGGSLPPLDALRLAGVDMATPQPVREAMDWFEEILGEMETLCQ